MGAKIAQFCLRGGTAHIQYGVKGEYEKIDTKASPEMVAAFNAAKAAGTTSNSLYGSSTPYAPLEVRDIHQRTFLTVVPPTPPVGVIVYVDNGPTA